MRSYLALFAALAGIARAQPAAAPLTFEVATIRPAPPLDPAKMMKGQMRIGAKIDAGRAEYNFTSVKDLIVTAYGVKPYQVTGPDWMTSERWDIQAKLPEGATAAQVPEMLKALLAERFKLTVHKEVKEHSVYALVPGKGGPKFKEYQPEPAAPASEAENTPATSEGKSGDGKSGDGKPSGGPRTMSMTVNGSEMSVKTDPKGGASIRGGEMGNMKVTPSQQTGMMHFEFQQMKMARFVDFISNMVDKPVVDMTELKGTYEIAMDLSMQDMMSMARKSGAFAGGGPVGPGGPGGAGSARPADAASDPGASSVFTTVEQLGLKLAPRKTPIEQIVVDHVEKTPTEN